MALQPDEEIVEVSLGISKAGLSFDRRFHVGKVVTIPLLHAIKVCPEQRHSL
jgi:hypothetical protein